MVKHGLLNDLVCPLQQRLGDCEAECRRRFEIDHKLELSGLLNRKIAGLSTLQDLDVISTLASCPA